MPPLITALRPWNLISRAPKNKHVLDLRAALERQVDDSLCRNSLSTPTPFVGGKDYATLAIVDAVTKGLRRKASEYHRVDGTNARTSEEGGDGLPGHRKVDRDSVAFLDTEGLEYIGNAGDFVQQFSKGDLTARARLISFVDNRRLSDITDQIWDMMITTLQRPTLLGHLKAQRSTQLYDAFKPPSGNQEISPFSKLPERTVVKGLSQCNVSRATFLNTRSQFSGHRFFNCSSTCLRPILVRVGAD
jgi:hypothetical protein